jgi:carbon starvation protein CstA
MIEKVHQHIINELQQGARTDTIFVLTAVLFNLIVLAVNSGVAGSAVSDKPQASDDVILIIFIILIMIVNVVSVRALSTGKKTRILLLQGLMSMYRDNQVDKYYDSTLLANYDKRYLSFSIVILCIGLIAVVVPLAIRFV